MWWVDVFVEMCGCVRGRASVAWRVGGLVLASACVGAGQPVSLGVVVRAGQGRRWVIRINGLWIALNIDCEVGACF